VIFNPKNFIFSLLRWCQKFISSLEFFNALLRVFFVKTPLCGRINKYQTFEQQAASSSRRLHHSATVLLTNVMVILG
jgi:hypothetical protein